jgi:tRNA threonylcarbamoyladenosine biosynthesis protein TsaB
MPLWTLGIETATAAGGVALMRDATLVAERAFERGMTHGRDVAPAIEALLRAHGLTARDLGLVAVDVGPGSHTGVRVGVAAARGLALGAGCALAGVVSLEAMAADGPGVPVIDAGRKRLFARLPEGIVSITSEELARRSSAARNERPPRAATIARLGREAHLRGEGAPVSPVYIP